MPSSEVSREVEERLRKLLADNDLPPPDAVEHHATEVVFLYRDAKVAVVVEFDEPG